MTTALSTEESIESVQIESSLPHFNNNNNTYHTSTTAQQQLQSMMENPSRAFVYGRYVGLSALALVASLTCPQVAAADDEDSWLYAKLLVTCLATLAALVALQGSDPGYLTADTVAALLDDDEDEVALLEETTESSPTTDNTATCNRMNQRRNSLPNDPLAAAVVVNQSNPNDDDSYYRSTRRKFCEICQFAPPLRSHHCKTCDKCVATFDHHCQFVGTCIGERNHCRFWWFLFFQTITFWMLCHRVGSSKLGIWTFFNGTTGGSVDAMRVVLAKIYLYFLSASSFLILGMHTLFALANATTFECAKGHKLEYLKGATESLMDLPFSQRSVFANLQLFCCHRDDATRRTVARSNRPDWKPMAWQPPGKIVRDSEDWWEHPLQNKYWSCC